MKFISTNPDTIGRKRKPWQRACDSCRKKKRRCGHVQDPAVSQRFQTHARHQASPQRPRPPQPLLQTSPSSQRSRTPSDDAHDIDTTVVSPAGDLPLPTNATHYSSRFIGDLNPEGMLMAATSPNTTRGISLKDSIGTWLASFRHVDSEDASTEPHGTELSLFHGTSTLAQKFLIPILREECLSLVPPTPYAEQLCDYYFDNIHPMFPVIDPERSRNMQSRTPSQILLTQAMCLTASMNPVCEQELWLPDAQTVSSPREFGKRLLSAMRCSIELGLVTDKVVLLQALTLMSLFVEGPAGADISVLLHARASQLVYSLGLHLAGNGDGWAESHATTLLCCVWAVDRMNAAFHGRPVLMHERDIGRDLEFCIDAQQTTFRLLLRTVMLLDRVISLYRPTRSAETQTWDGEFPSFEEIVTTCGAATTSTPTLATIEIFYHAIAILSSRPKPDETIKPSSIMHVRQVNAATQITAMVGEEFRNQLLMLPFVPYAVSLSLSIAYREMRHSKIPMYRARARNQLYTNCTILEALGKHFWTASIMANMGKSTLREMDRVIAVATESQRPRQPAAACRTTTTTSNRDHSGPSVRTPLSDDAQRESGQPNSFSHSNSNTQGSNDVLPSLDPSLYPTMLDIDIFDMFDPSFDLDGVDACLEGHLDLSFPTNLL